MVRKVAIILDRGNWHKELISSDELREDRALRREHLAWAAGGALLLLLLAGGAVLAALLSHGWLPAGDVDVGPVGQVLAGIPRYVAPSGATDQGFFLVRTNDGIRALSVMPSHERARPVVWDSGPQLFIDPALGCAFKEDGSYLRGPCIRDLDQYPVTVRDGRVLVDRMHLIRGQAHG